MRRRNFRALALYHASLLVEQGGVINKQENIEKNSGRPSYPKSPKRSAKRRLHPFAGKRSNQLFVSGKAVANALTITPSAPPNARTPSRRI